MRVHAGSNAAAAAEEEETVKDRPFHIWQERKYQAEGKLKFQTNYTRW